MNIAEMHVTPIAISDPPLLNAAGLHAPFALRVVLELVSDNGLYGLAEVPGGELVAQRLKAVESLVLGQDPFNLNYLEDVVSKHFASLTVRQRAPIIIT